MSKFKIIFGTLISLSVAILVFGKSYRIYSTDTRPDGKYSVQIFQIYRYYEFNMDYGYHDALIQVNDKHDKVLKKMWDTPAIMCAVDWDEKGVYVGGQYYEFEKQR